MHSCYVRVAGKVFVVERQNALDAMHSHRRDQTRVVNLHARDAMRYQNTALLFMNGKAVREEPEFFLEGFCQSICLLGREAVAIAVHRPSTGIPKLANILGRITENAIVPKNRVGG